MQLYGNLFNRIMESPRSTEPHVGMGATLTMYTDRRAGTVIDVGPKYITVQCDKATRSDSNGMSECQSYTYAPNSSGAVYCFKRDTTGRWREVTRNPETNRYRLVPGGCGLLLGDRDEYYDFSF